MGEMEENQPLDGLFEGLFEDGWLRSAFVSLRTVEALGATHPALSPAETRFLEGLRFEKRRRDWIGGRLAAKRAVLRLAGSSCSPWRPELARTVEILPGPDREPQVFAGAVGLSGGLRVSISHSGQFAGAVAWLADGWTAGLDMEYMGEIERSLYSIAFLPFEISSIDGAPECHRDAWVHAFWTAKEAISKAIGTGLSICLQDIELSVAAECLSDAVPGRFLARVRGGEAGSDRRFTVHNERIGGYVLSLAVSALQGAKEANLNEGREA